jgi:hypothetical protein
MTIERRTVNVCLGVFVAILKNEANSLETTGVYWCSFVVNWKKQSQFRKGENECNPLYCKGLRE